MSHAKTLAIYAGTFDPLTSGHVSIIRRACTLFDKLIIAVAKDTGKNTLFNLEERVELARQTFKGNDKIEVEAFDGLLVEYARKKGSPILVRGLRAVSDFDYELQSALMNRKLDPQIETVFLMASLQWMYISSTIIRNAATLGGNIYDMVPPPVLEALRAKFNHSPDWSMCACELTIEQSNI